MSAHTPGPWSYIPSKREVMPHDTIVTSGSRVRIPPHKAEAVVLSVGHYRCENGEANARLIAAAPDLLELLILALPYVEEGEQFNKPSCRGLSQQIRALVEKVEGGAS